MPTDRATLQAMGRAMVHRGPDDEGQYVGPQIGLAFRRLAIVDLAAGRQPMSNEDGRIQLLFNGEIYDHVQLRRELEANGHRFATDHSDTEVLVHGWEEWGYDLFGRLNGMFAVAIWDTHDRRLVLARDRHGVKPLYLALLPGGSLVFASEIRAILASGLVEREPAASGILEYFAFQNLWGRQTMFQGIEQLEAGTVLTWQGGSIGRRCFWDITFPRSRRSTLPELAEEHRAILQRVVRRQLAADVPVHSYLSGGIDSTALTVAAHQLDRQVTAYSVIFDLENVGADREVDERDYSRLVARTHGLPRVELELPAGCLRECLDDYVSSMEDLRMGMGYPVYLIAREVARNAKVVLSGTGGDEFHGGYLSRYQALARSQPGHGSFGLRRLLRACRHWLSRNGRSRPGESSFQSAYRNMLNCVLKPEQWPMAFTPEFLEEAGELDVGESIRGLLARCPSDDWRDQVMYVDAKTYLAGLLTFEDKVSMAHALETRVPLLDNELVDFVLDVPFEFLWQGDVGKIVFRESVRPWVPEPIYQKPKMGFGPPDASWYRGRLRPWIEQVLAPDVCRQRLVFQPAFVEAVLQGHFSGQQNNTYLIWSLLNFELWCQAFGFYGAVRNHVKACA